MWRQEMLPSILHGRHFNTIGGFSFKNFVPDIFDQTSYVIIIGYFVRFHVLTAASMKMDVFWVVAPRNL
jgi:hypothetical protein